MSNDSIVVPVVPAAVPDASPDASPVTRPVAKRAATRKPAAVPLPSRVRTMAELVAVGRHITGLTGSVDSIVTTVGKIITRYAPTNVPNAARNVSAIDGRRVMAVQNDIVRLSPAVSDIAFAAMCRIAFPAAVGMFTSGSLADGVRIAGGIRAEWTRHGHGDPAWKSGMTAPIAADGPSASAVRASLTRASAMDAGVRTNGNA